jgi:hypothetical protein
MCKCLFLINTGLSGAIQTKLGTHTTLTLEKNTVGITYPIGAEVTSKINPKAWNFYSKFNQKLVYLLING